MTGRSAPLVFNTCGWQHDCTQIVEWHYELARAPNTGAAVGQEETDMDEDYMFLCGVMWCRFGQPEAGDELLRAATSVDPDMRALAWAMLSKGALRLRDLKKGAAPVLARS